MPREGMVRDESRKESTPMRSCIRHMLSTIGPSSMRWNLAFPPQFPC